VSTPETPRTWTLWICNECGLTTASFPPRGLCYSVKVHDNYSMTQVEVVEKASVDVERERLLDLLERVEDWLQVPDYMGYSDLVSARQVEADVKTVLREYGRLGHRRSGA
jgi:hypothetical protein